MRYLLFAAGATMEGSNVFYMDVMMGVWAVEPLRHGHGRV